MPLQTFVKSAALTAEREFRIVVRRARDLSEPGPPRWRQLRLRHPVPSPFRKARPVPLSRHALIAFRMSINLSYSLSALLCPARSKHRNECAQRQPLRGPPLRIISSPPSRRRSAPSMARVARPEPVLSRAGCAPLRSDEVGPPLRLPSWNALRRFSGPNYRLGSNANLSSVAAARRSRSTVHS
jgi:hypothetical protein